MAAYWLMLCFITTLDILPVGLISMWSHPDSLPFGRGSSSSCILNQGSAGCRVPTVSGWPSLRSRPDRVALNVYPNWPCCSGVVSVPETAAALENANQVRKSLSCCIFLFYFRFFFLYCGCNSWSLRLMFRKKKPNPSRVVQLHTGKRLQVLMLKKNVWKQKFRNFICLISWKSKT